MALCVQSNTVSSGTPEGRTTPFYSGGGGGSMSLWFQGGGGGVKHVCSTSRCHSNNLGIVLASHCLASITFFPFLFVFFVLRFFCLLLFLFPNVFFPFKLRTWRRVNTNSVGETNWDCISKLISGCMKDNLSTICHASVFKACFWVALRFFAHFKIEEIVLPSVWKEGLHYFSERGEKLGKEEHAETCRRMAKLELTGGQEFLWGASHHSPHMSVPAESLSVLLGSVSPCVVGRRPWLAGYQINGDLNYCQHKHRAPASPPAQLAGAASHWPLLEESNGS